MFLVPRLDLCVLFWGVNWTFFPSWIWNCFGDRYQQHGHVLRWQVFWNEDFLAWKWSCCFCVLQIQMLWYVMLVYDTSMYYHHLKKPSSDLCRQLLHWRHGTGRCVPSFGSAFWPPSTPWLDRCLVSWCRWQSLRGIPWWIRKLWMQRLDVQITRKVGLWCYDFSVNQISVGLWRHDRTYIRLNHTSEIKT